jgi:hypothetical protein
MRIIQGRRYIDMATRVYLLLELVNGNKATVAAALKNTQGIVGVDTLEGPPDLITVIEAPARQKAAEYLMGVLDLVDGVVEDIRVLPVQESVETNTRIDRGDCQRTDTKLREEMKQHV